jgi:hypothetical protein
MLSYGSADGEVSRGCIDGATFGRGIDLGEDKANGLLERNSSGETSLVINSPPDLLFFTAGTVRIIAAIKKIWTKTE